MPPRVWWAAPVYSSPGEVECVRLEATNEKGQCLNESGTSGEASDSYESYPSPTTGQEIEVILARQLAGYLALPMVIVDPSHIVIFYNEPAERMLGRRF